jgi:hypothetical protein
VMTVTCTLADKTNSELQFARMLNFVHLQSGSITPHPIHTPPLPDASHFASKTCRLSKVAIPRTEFERPHNPSQGELLWVFGVMLRCLIC